MIGIGIAKSTNLLAGYEPELYGPSTNGALSDQLAPKTSIYSKPSDRRESLSSKDIPSGTLGNSETTKMQQSKKESSTGSYAINSASNIREGTQSKNLGSIEINQKSLKTNQESIKRRTLVKTSNNNIESHRTSLISGRSSLVTKSGNLSRSSEKSCENNVTNKSVKKEESSKVDNISDASNAILSKETFHTATHAKSQTLNLSSHRKKEDVTQTPKIDRKDHSKDNVSSFCNAKNSTQRLEGTAKKQNDNKVGSGSMKQSDCFNGQSQLIKSSRHEREVEKASSDGISHVKESLLLPGENRVYHLRVQSGDLYNRILVVGHAGRADLLAQRLFDPNKARISFSSNHFFRVHSGYFKDTRVSIVSVGMGAPMMDIFVREASLVTDGTLAIIRLGTCMLLNPNYPPGALVACEGSIGCYTNYSYFDSCFNESDAPAGSPYTITKPCLPNPELNQLLINRAECKSGAAVPSGLNISCENYYSCQCRAKGYFRDENDNLWKQLLSTNADTMEMDTHQLFHLANRRRKPIHAAALHVGLTNRMDDSCVHPITPQLLNRQILVAACACLEALISHQIEK